MPIGFDPTQYMTVQREKILERIERTQGRLYLEFGGKLLDDYHAARVLPGFDAGGKAALLQTLSDRLEILLCINAGDIEKNKLRADLGITYERDVLRLMDDLRGMGLHVGAVVITQYRGQPGADIFRKKLEMREERVFVHQYTKGYPTDIATIVSEEGYGANPYIPCTQPLVVVTAPGPGSGKLATCLSQMYHEHRQDRAAGYAKFETFPIWNLPINHPVNLAYEAATADLDDVNMIDPFHLDAYGETAVNYNRDVEVFPILQAILSRITQAEGYRSPTDMGVNMAGRCITDDVAVCEAARQEILRRYYRTRLDHKLGRVEETAIHKVEMIMSRLNLRAEDRDVVAPALAKERERGAPAVAVRLPDGHVVAGRATGLMSAPAAAVLNAMKSKAGIPDDLHLIMPGVLSPIQRLKNQTYRLRSPVLNLDEVLIALTISAATNPLVERALLGLESLRGCEAHATYILPETDEEILRRLDIRLTCEPDFPGKNLYYE
ncbi:MAG: DUF1846 domain-containing protein [Oscillospiraceae bacterium]|nr:DUF1846 domain-containing protein [Oscillospiraceae bacterium]